MELQHPVTCPVVQRGRVSTAVAAVAAALILTSVAPGAVARADEGDDAAERAAEEIQAARDRANEAAAAYTQADFELEALEEQASQLDAQQVELQAQVDALRTKVEQVAVNRFVSSGNSGIPLLTGYQAPSERLQTDVLVNVVTESSADAMDDYDQARKDLEANQRELDANQDALERKQEQFQQLQKNAEAEVVHLQEVEKKRLEDERIRKALEAKLAEEKRQRDLKEQQDRANAEAAAQQAAQERAQQQATQPAAASASASAAAAPTPAPSRSASSQQAPSGAQLPEAPAPQSDNDEPEPAPPPPAPRGRIQCPVSGTAYSDTWGAARSGGRSHQGVDMLGSRGTPLRAVVSGSVLFKQNSLGGNAVWLTGSDGNKYYYAHLDSFEGSSRGVSQGEVIGYLGDTGNARGTPHLHFEVHPGGGAAVNPYPWVRDAGC